jgi:hypothetical protein
MFWLAPDGLLRARTFLSPFCKLVVFVRNGQPGSPSAEVLGQLGQGPHLLGAMAPVRGIVNPGGHSTRVDPIWHTLLGAVHAAKLRLFVRMPRCPSISLA